MSKQWLVVVAAIPLFLAASILGRPQESLSPAAITHTKSHLFKDSREFLAMARAQGEQYAALLVAAKPGMAAAVAHRAETLGGSIRYQDREIGYLRVRLPIRHIVPFADSDEIEAAALDSGETHLADGADSAHRPSGLVEGLLPQSARLSPRGARPAQRSINQGEAWPPQWSDYPLRHPYSPLGDIDAAAFLERHPTYDGRGVTIALLDYNVDLLSPELQTAYTVDGNVVPKVADVFAVCDPREDSALEGMLVDMRNVVIAEKQVVTVRGKSFRTPYDGRFHIGFLDLERVTVQGLRAGSDVHDSALLGILWDDATNIVWVDTNSDGDFSDERGMTDYARRHEVGVLGKDDPATPVRESSGFTIQIDAEEQFVYVNIGNGTHATNVIGAAVANPEPSGRLRGIAPGARLVSIRYCSPMHGLTEALIAAFKHPDVDLIVSEPDTGNDSIMTKYSLADGHHLISVISQRLIEHYRKPLFVPGGNMPGLGLVGEVGLAEAAISVGGYQSRESYRINYGVITPNVDNLHFGAKSHGPSGSGALKPDLLAPSGVLSTAIAANRGLAERGLFQLPAGYTIYGGTSTAAPVAAGAAALVVSAARQSGLKVDAVTLKSALTNSARYVDALAAHEQGNGLIQVSAAFELLRRRQSSPSITVISQGPVRTRLGPLLPIPNEGVGLYEREGWSAGDRGTRVIGLTRTSGPTEPLTVAVSWLGNDGTFSSATSVDLPLNTMVELPIAIHVEQPGAHSAILTLDHASVPGHIHRILVTVVAALRFTPENQYSVTADIPMRLGDRGVFVDVPPGVAALTLSPPGAEFRRRYVYNAVSPAREEFQTIYEPCRPNAPASEPCVVVRPEPGVWEILADPFGFEFDPRDSNSLGSQRITVSLLGVAVSLSRTESIKSPASVESRDGSLTLTNQFAPVSASATSIPLGSARETKAQIRRGEQHLYEVNVPEGTTSLSARIAEVTDVNADLDLYAFHCDNDAMAIHKCMIAAKDIDRSSKSEIEVFNPDPGRWTIVVDGYLVPRDAISYIYADVFMHPKFGSFDVTDFPMEHNTMESWTTVMHVWLAMHPDAPRRLYKHAVVTCPIVRTRYGPVWLGRSIGEHIPIETEFKRVGGSTR